MGVSKAQEIIDRAMADRSFYDAMAIRENEFWGRFLAEVEQSPAAAGDAKASAALNAARNQSSLFKVAQEKGLTFESGLTLGCGTGRLERALVQSGVCRNFHGIDISGRAIDVAREIAHRDNLPLTYEVADLNRLRLSEGHFDVVVAQTCLHHVLFLEHVAEQVWRCLQPGGYLWIHDFIGETQSQYETNRLAIANQILAILPEKFRRNTIHRRVITQIKRPEPGHLSSPFESIRSGEILDIFDRWFEIEWKNEFNAFLQLVAPPGTRAAYVENTDTKALFEILMLLDQLCIEQDIIPPAGGQYLMRRKHVTLDELRRLRQPYTAPSAEKHTDRLTTG
jgi:2-polyprenyl-3-methyl-5-hydroxy-6-metoxy-1,4-benzoquinol methylase